MPTIRTLIQLAITGLVLYLLYVVAATLIANATILGVIAIILVLVFIAAAASAFGIA